MNDSKSSHPAPSLTSLISAEHDATGAERVQEAVRSAPSVIIAVMAHVIVAAVLGMLYFDYGKKGPQGRRQRNCIVIAQPETDLPAALMPAVQFGREFLSHIVAAQRHHAGLPAGERDCAARFATAIASP